MQNRAIWPAFRTTSSIHILDGLLTSKRDIAQQLKSSERHWTVDSDFRLATVRFEPNEFENHLLHMRTMGMLLGNFESHAYSYKDTALIIFHKPRRSATISWSISGNARQALKRVIVVSGRFNDFSQSDHTTSKTSTYTNRKNRRWLNRASFRATERFRLLRSMLPAIRCRAAIEPTCSALI